MTEIQWRRRWKPDLNSCPWQKLEIKGSEFTTLLVKAKFSENSYEFLATDLTEYWYETVEENILRKRSETLNPNLEAPLTRIVELIKAGLEKPGNETNLKATKKTDGIVIKINSKIADSPFAWTFKADAAEYEMGRDHLIVPLMAMVGELFRQQKELYKLLAAKDKQLDDYKAQGVQVTRKHLETVPFDAVVFQNNMVTSKGFEGEVLNFGENAFVSTGQELYRQMATKRAWLTIGAKESDGQESDDRPQGAPSIESWASRLPSSMAQRNISPSKTSPSKKSPEKTPTKSSTSSNESTPVKDTELLRRQALERKLEQEEIKMKEKSKKKKKLKL